MERSEEELKMMCQRLVRFEEFQLRTNDPDISLELEIHKDRNMRWRGEIVKKSETESCCHWYFINEDDEGLGMLFIKIIYLISYRYGLLDIYISDAYNIVLKPGMLEELDLKLSSVGF